MVHSGSNLGQESHNNTQSNVQRADGDRNGGNNDSEVVVLNHTFIERSNQNSNFVSIPRNLTEQRRLATLRQSQSSNRNRHRNNFRVNSPTLPRIPVESTVAPVSNINWMSRNMESTSNRRNAPIGIIERDAERVIMTFEEQREQALIRQRRREDNANNGINASPSITQHFNLEYPAGDQIEVQSVESGNSPTVQRRSDRLFPEIMTFQQQRENALRAQQNRYRVALHEREQQLPQITVNSAPNTVESAEMELQHQNETDNSPPRVRATGYLSPENLQVVSTLSEQRREAFRRLERQHQSAPFAQPYRGPNLGLRPGQTAEIRYAQPFTEGEPSQREQSSLGVPIYEIQVVRSSFSLDWQDNEGSHSIPHTPPIINVMYGN